MLINEIKIVRKKKSISLARNEGNRIIANFGTKSKFV